FTWQLQWRTQERAGHHHRIAERANHAATGRDEPDLGRHAGLDTTQCGARPTTAGPGRRLDTRDAGACCAGRPEFCQSIVKDCTMFKWVGRIVAGRKDKPTVLAGDAADSAPQPGPDAAA